MNLLRLVRWKNLLIIFLTQAAVWLFLLRPQTLLTSFDGASLLATGRFVLLTLSTILIAAGGYVINDYFDVRIDAINKPHTMVLEHSVPRRMAIILHNLLNGVGLAIAGYLAFKSGQPVAVLLQVATILLLWFYSTHFKRQLITGNVVVALLTGLSIIAVAVYTEPWGPGFSGSGGAPHFIPAGYTVPVFTLFAVLLTWIREIVKDMEDVHGDRSEGCNTLPIVYGLDYAARFAQVLGGAAALILAGIAGSVALFGHGFLALYIAVALVAPLIYVSTTIHPPYTPRHLHLKSRQLKMIMISGIGAMGILFLEPWIRSF